MPYRDLDEFLAQTQVNVVKIYDFPGKEYDEPALVPLQLAEDILKWLEKKSNQLNPQVTEARYPAKKSGDRDVVKTFSAP